MIRSLGVGLAAAVVLCCSPSPSLGADLDAFVLAIRHFDPGHVQGVAYDGPEADFMRQVLEAAREDVPAVAGIHGRVDDPARSGPGPSPYRSLRVRHPDDITGRDEQRGAALKAIAESIGLDCRREEQTNSRYQTDRPTSTTKRTRWDLDPVCIHAETDRVCANAELVDWLCSMGIETVTLQEHAYREQASVQLHLGYRGYVDLEYCAGQLMADPRYPAVFGDFTLEPEPGDAIGDGTSIRVVPTPGLAGYDGVRLEFSYGWGDCPAGCIWNHYWVFEYRAAGDPVEGEWPLSGGLVGEHGDPLTGGAR